MKKLVAALVLLFGLGISTQAQTAEELIAQGNTAYKANDFTAAFTAFSKAIELNTAAGVLDTVIYYNAGYCAYKSKQYELVPDYFKKAIELGYKAELSYVMLSDSYKRANRDTEYETILVEAYTKYPSNKNLIRFMADYQFKKGLEHYNKASELIGKADKVRETDVKQFNAFVAEAKLSYEASLPFFLQVNDLKPDTKNLPEALSGVYEALGNAEEAAKWKALIGK